MKLTPLASRRKSRNICGNECSVFVYDGGDGYFAGHVSGSLVFLKEEGRLVGFFVWEDI